jgi:uncharacterized membrane protein YphA (DoxX/SURF4 family)
MTAGHDAPSRQRRAVVLDVVGLLARLGLGVVWLLSGIPKAANPRDTIVAVRAYDLLPRSLVEPVAGILPFLEIALGLLLIVGLATRLVAVLSAVVLIVFIGAVISAAARGLSIDCGCFGGGGAVAPDETTYLAEILRDVGFLVLAGYLVVRPDTPLSIDRLVRRRVTDTANPA